MSIISMLISLLPVGIFLVLLIVLDSYKLIKVTKIIQFIGAGIILGGVGLVVNNFLLDFEIISRETLIRVIAPLLEELLKAIIPFYLLKKNKIGFPIDAAIIGFAVGSGFALFENVYYLLNVTETNLFFWIIRGFGTAIMHGGTAAIFAMLSIYTLSKSKTTTIRNFWTGFAVMIIIHFLFNNLTILPLYKVLSQIIVLPICLVFIFAESEKGLKKWLEIGFDSHLELLNSLKSGQFKNSKTGKYLGRFSKSLKQEILFDLHCYLRVYLELAIRSKGILMMREAGFDEEVEPEIKDKFNELKYLEKSIGLTGKQIVAPLLNISVKDLWQIYFLSEQ